jgi:hypothetical protein
MEIKPINFSEYIHYIFFYLFGFFIFYLIDKYIFPQENNSERIYIMQDDEKLYLNIILKNIQKN